MDFLPDFTEGVRDFSVVGVPSFKIAFNQLNRSDSRDVAM